MSSDSSPLQRFVVEAREHLATMTSAIMALERGDGEPAAHLNELLRATHSLKGGAGFCGRRTIETLAHALETTVEGLRAGAVVATPAVVDALLFALDRINVLVDDAGHSEEAEISEPLDRLRQLTSAAVPPPPGAVIRPDQAAAFPAAIRAAPGPGEFPISQRVLDAWGERAGFLYGVKLDWFQCERAFGLEPAEAARRLARAGTVLDSRIEPSSVGLGQGLPPPPLWYWAIVASRHGPEDFARELDIPCAAVVRLERVDNGRRPRAAPPPPSMARPPAPASSFRIPVALVDHMLGLAGELVLIRNQAAHASGAAGAPARDLIRRLSAITNELQAATLRMRMQPVGTLFDRFPRLVRDLARQLGKQIDLVIGGAEVELDKTILELLADPLTHLVRNCCDHGIESPEARIAAGKPATGVIRLAARQERGQIVVEISDDGRGLSCDAIRRKAVQQGLKREDELARLSDRQLYSLILHSGFSTADKVTDLSGRGVGMDVVRTNLEQVGGVVEIDSAAGRGATFTLRLPLTLAIVPCLILQSGAQRFVLPQRDVEEVVLLDPADGRVRIECGDDEELLRLRGGLLPVARLTEVLGRRESFTPAVWAEIAARYHAEALEPRLQFVVVLKVGTQRFGLVVDGVLGNADIVVKPLHPLLRALGIYTGATILGDGSVALILSGEGLARHSGITYRPRDERPATAAPSAAGAQAVLQFRSGPAELFAAPLEAVRRVVRIARERIERIGEREYVDIDGRATNVVRLDQFLNVSPCAERETLFVILPRRAAAPVGLLASEIVDAPTQVVELDVQAFHADGVLGTVMMRGQIALFLDIDRLVTMWTIGRDARSPSLPAPAGKRILVVEDTRFFQKLVTGCLQSAGYSVVAVDNARDGIARLDAEVIDLVVSDIEMPGMDGLALAEHVRGDARFEQLPLLALTSLAGDEHRERSIAAGFDAHQVKFDPDNFLATVRMLLSRGRMRLAESGAAPRE